MVAETGLEPVSPTGRQIFLPTTTFVAVSTI